MDLVRLCLYRPAGYPVEEGVVKLQLLGPMSNLPDFNYPAFNAAAGALRQLGHEVFNPAETAGGDTTLPRAFYMRAALGALLNAEGAVLLPGWETSEGAQVEFKVAAQLGLLIVPLEAVLYVTEREIPDSPDD
jgi:hypothetical protein